MRGTASKSLHSTPQNECAASSLGKKQAVVASASSAAAMDRSHDGMYDDEGACDEDDVMELVSDDGASVDDLGYDEFVFDFDYTRAEDCAEAGAVARVSIVDGFLPLSAVQLSMPYVAGSPFGVVVAAAVAPVTALALPSTHAPDRYGPCFVPHIVEEVRSRLHDEMLRATASTARTLIVDAVGGAVPPRVSYVCVAPPGSPWKLVDVLPQTMVLIVPQRGGAISAPAPGAAGWGGHEDV